MTATPAAPRPAVLSVLTPHPDESRAGALGSTPGVSHPPHLAAPKGASPEAPTSFAQQVSEKDVLFATVVGEITGLDAYLETVGIDHPDASQWAGIVASARKASEALDAIVRGGSNG